MKLPLHSDFLLTVPSCPSSPQPATMADKEEQRDADLLWKDKPCQMENSAAGWRGEYGACFVWAVVVVVG